MNLVSAVCRPAGHKYVVHASAIVILILLLRMFAYSELGYIDNAAASTLNSYQECSTLLLQGKFRFSNPDHRSILLTRTLHSTSARLD
jgi:hypothetical protein